MCKIGEAAIDKIPPGGDTPMRHAVEQAYYNITGEEASGCFSGWGGEFTAHERAVINNVPAAFKDIHPELKRDAAEEMYNVVSELEPLLESLSENRTQVKLTHGADPARLLEQLRIAKGKADGR